MATPRPFKPSPAMLAVLANAEAGRDLGHHLHGRAEFGGFSGTLLALYRHQLLSHPDRQLTEAGRAALAADRAQDAARQARLQAAWAASDAPLRPRRRR